MRIACGHLHLLSNNDACVHPSILGDDIKLLPHWTQDLLEECRTIDTRSVNPNKSTFIDSILQGLNSPAPQSLYVLQRAVHRFEKVLHQEQLRSGSRNDINTKCDSINHASEMLQATAYFVVKRGYRLVLLSTLVPDSTNLPRSAENATLSAEDEDPFVFQIFPVDQDVSETKWRDIIPSSTKPIILSTIQIANALLEEVTEASENQVELSSQDIRSGNDLLATAADRSLELLSWTMGMDLRGRTSADAAFAFALVGVRTESLFQALAVVSTYELLRVGKRPSFLSKYVLQIIEKHAAAGSKGPAVEALYCVAAGCLMEKGEHLKLAETLLGSAKNESIDNNDSNATTAPSLELLSARPLLWLWRFSARQRKAKKSSQPKSSSEADPSDTGAIQNEYTLSQGLRPSPPTLPTFPDSKRPLVVDLGCGMGTSLLGLASATQSVKDDTTMLGIDEVEDCNFLGADLSQLALGFGQGVADRWSLNNKLRFSWTTAEECLEMVEKSYEGQVALIMIQFPTPYRLATSSDSQWAGNSQLPSDFQTGFMVSDSLLAQVARILKQSGGKLLVQSNCEDVAVTIRQRVIAQYGMQCANVPQEVASMDHVKYQTLRSTEWIRIGGERAIGPGWSLTPLLPAQGKTETEVACVDQGTPIHRCILSF